MLSLLMASQQKKKKKRFKLDTSWTYYEGVLYGFLCKRNRGRKKDDAIHCIFSLVKLPILLQSSEICLVFGFAL